MRKKIKAKKQPVASAVIKTIYDLLGGSTVRVDVTFLRDKPKETRLPNPKSRK